MKNLIIISSAIAFLLACKSVPEAPIKISIIPKPVFVEAGKGDFTLNTKTSIYFMGGETEATTLIPIFTKELSSLTGIEIRPESRNSSRNQINLAITKQDSLPDEGYKLDITSKKISISSATPQGLFYGLQSLKQLILTAKGQGKELTLPALTIIDYPRFAYRGMMLDVGRYFMAKDSVLRFIDFLALYKFNNFHWHLTEDQGWRIEIKKYPKLTEIGAWRKETVAGHNRTEPRVYDGTPHGGFYTQEEIREVVRYAADRFINVIPEIDIPGHTQAAIASYPELGVSGKPLEVKTEWGISSNILNPSEQTIRFFQDVFDEVLDLFPSEYIHIGGDEARKDQWKSSPAIQKQIKSLGLQNEDELQSWFIRQMEKYLNNKGRRLIGWDEILEGGLAPNATVMSWRGVKGGIEAAEMGHDVIMTPNTFFYLDYYQADPKTEPLAIGGLLPIEKVYSFEPVPEELSPENAKHILGGQGNVWTEYMSSFKQVEYMTFPRITAVSEVVWSKPEHKDFADFSKRVLNHTSIFEILDINYSKSGMPEMNQ
jgi:hexosaminidase